MEHDLLQRAFVVGGVAAGVAFAVAAVMLAWWLNGRRRGQSVTAAAVLFFACLAVAGASAGWLVSQRHEKCGPTVTRKLCESPVDWLR